MQWPKEKKTKDTQGLWF